MRSNLKSQTAHRDLTIQYLPINAINADPDNARKHPDMQIARLAAGMEAFGFVNPILIDEQGVMIAGHGRLAAAIKAGFAKVPTIRIEGLTPAQRKMLALADNKLGELSSWDIDKLGIALAELDALDLDLSIELTGFATAEIDRMLDLSAATAQKADPADALPSVDPDALAITRRGDLWLLGKHRLLCGSALESESFERLLGTERADLIISDPPFNLKMNGHVTGLGKKKHPEFAMASGEMSGGEFTEFLTTTFKLQVAYSKNGSVHFQFMDWRHIREITAAGDAAYSGLHNVCVWDKGSGGMGSWYRSQHEFVFVFKNGTAPHINNVQLGRYGRVRTNVWSCPGLSSFGQGRNESLESHPTVKPISLIADAIRDCSKRGDLVLDPFVGSGSTLIAAERTRRRAAAIELSPTYVDTAVRRWQEFTGQEATLYDDGRTFAEIAQERRPSSEEAGA